MQLFETKPKVWGNSLGITIPSEMVKKERLSENREVSVLIIPKTSKEKLLKAFGSFKCTKPTQQIMDEIDERYD